MDEYFHVVSRYTRAPALADGVLRDVSDVGREARFKVPVALTQAAWVDCVAWGEEEDEAGGAVGQSESGRLWDVIYGASNAARLHRNGGRDRVPFSALRVPRRGRRMERIELLLHIGPGDEAEPVITIMRPLES